VLVQLAVKAFHTPLGIDDESFVMALEQARESAQDAADRLADVRNMLVNGRR